MAVVLFGDVLNKSSWYVSVLQSIFSVVHVVPRKYFSVVPKEKAMAPHSNTPAWKIRWMEEPGRLQSMGLLRVGHD